MNRLIIPDHGERIEYLGFGESFIAIAPSATSGQFFETMELLRKHINDEMGVGWFLRNVITVRVGNEGDALIAFFANGAPPVIVENPHDE